MPHTHTPSTRTAPRVSYTCDPSPSEQALAELALAMSGLGSLAPKALSDMASWERSNHPSVVGRGKILDALSQITPPISLSVTQITLEGKAATVTGRLTREGQGLFLFCQILRFTTPERTEIAQIISVEQKER
ncbi:hypothetical protein [Celeribacter sp. PS-C1]|uniref:hypothetical protein n=1 Tax=Celeribacter sp. PS-C1 TaxID=2820813 RepID=UPI001CA4FEBD|nr:hypothetical protein [Celeribacter sp. PS-C1]MBW6416616.1 hypothetical protein [Celeribacter sp. PS-C1]